MTALIYEIHTGDCKPVKQPPHRIPAYQWEVINQQLEELFAIWSSAVVLSRKHDRTYYIYIEYRTLNQLTKKNTIPLHQTDDVLEPLGGVQCVPLGTDRCEWNKRIVLRLRSQLIRFNSSGELCLLDRQTDPLSSFLLLAFFIWCSLTLTGHTVYYISMISSSGRPSLKTTSTACG